MPGKGVLVYLELENFGKIRPISRKGDLLLNQIRASLLVFKP